MDLHDRLTRALAQGRGLKLSAEDLDDLILAGVYDLLSAAVGKQLKEAAEQRIARRNGGA